MNEFSENSPDNEKRHDVSPASVIEENMPDTELAKVIIQDAKNFTQQADDIRTKLSFYHFKYENIIKKFKSESDNIKIKLTEIESARDVLEIKKDKSYITHNEIDTEIIKINSKIESIKEELNNIMSTNEGYTHNNALVKIRVDNYNEKISILENDHKRLTAKLEVIKQSISRIEMESIQSQRTVSNLITEYNNIQSIINGLDSLRTQLNNTSYNLQRSIGHLTKQYSTMEDVRVEAKSASKEYNDTLKELEEKGLKDVIDQVKISANSLIENVKEKEDLFNNLSNSYDEQKKLLDQIQIQLNDSKEEENCLHNKYQELSSSNDDLTVNLAEIKKMEILAYSNYEKIKENEIHMMVELSSLSEKLEKHTSEINQNLNNFAGRCNYVRNLLGKYGEDALQMERQLSSFELPDEKKT